MPNFIEIGETFFMDGRTDGRTDGTDGHLRPALLGRLGRRVDLITWAHAEDEAFLHCLEK